MMYALVAVAVLLWTTSCVATRYLCDVPFVGKWGENLFWFFAWPMALVVEVRDYHIGLQK